MKTSSNDRGRLIRHSVAAAALCLFASSQAWALGLGRLSVQSALGEALRAEIDITSMSPEESANLRVRIAPPDAYRAAGIDYNAVLPGTQTVLMRRADGRPYLRLTSERAVQEPFVDVILELSWPTGRLVREYTLLLDPPNARATAAASAAASGAASGTSATAATAMASAPEPAAPTAPAVTAGSTRAESRPAAPPPAASAPTATAAAPTPAPEKGSAGADRYRVRPGDTLYRIAGQTLPSGASLDQMLVALYRGNQQAFIGNNMNRLRSGVVLTVPSKEAVLFLTPAQANTIVNAQSSDFGAYRQRLASAAPLATPAGTPQKASGKVESNVRDNKPLAAATPDKLTLSKGAAAAKALEEKISKDKEKAATSQRVAELSKNLEELKKLSGAASSVAAGQAAPPLVAAKPQAPAASVPMPAIVAAPVPTPAPVIASTPVPMPSTTAAASAPAMAVPTSPIRPTPATAEADEPGIIGTMLRDNPLPLALGGAAILALLGFAAFRFTRRSRADSGETSFLESRLQPDSFFGNSGGQRIDTRDASGAASSMSYSLSQLDAIGDVDPVAEADVYLAYGRDLQAEEILKEAMRSTPDRLAIRTKLLEVYAKRRDTKGFEQLAVQLFAMTSGKGEDWSKAQELGAQIDPENALYQPGGAPLSASLGRSEPGHLSSEPLGASTMPQSVLPSPSQFGQAPGEGVQIDPSSVDLDLDLDLGGPVLPPAPSPVSAPVSAPVSQSFKPSSFDFSTPAAAPAPKPAPVPPGQSFASSGAMEFDLSSISLDLDPPKNSRLDDPLARPSKIGDDDFMHDDGADPLARKLELAEEFRQIGDLEGARDLIQEVASKATGGLKTRAQGMLDELG